MSKTEKENNGCYNSGYYGYEEVRATAQLKGKIHPTGLALQLSEAELETARRSLLGELVVDGKGEAVGKVVSAIINGDKIIYTMYIKKKTLGTTFSYQFDTEHEI